MPPLAFITNALDALSSSSFARRLSDRAFVLTGPAWGGSRVLLDKADADGHGGGPVTSGNHAPVVRSVREHSAPTRYNTSMNSSPLTPRLFVFLLLICGTGLMAQDREEPLNGGVFAGAGGAFDFDRDSSDLFLHIGGVLEFPVRPRVSLTGNVGFVANVSDNDAFDNRSLMADGGVRYFLGGRRLRPFVNAGYSFADGEIASHHALFVGAGVRSWYGRTIGWQLEARDRIYGDLNLLEVTLSVLLR